MTLIECEPDDKYNYYACESTVAGLFIVRERDGKCNIFVNNKWGKDFFDFSQMRPQPTCNIVRIVKKKSWLLPSRLDYLNQENN
jgi:hypothetical protein